MQRLEQCIASQEQHLLVLIVGATRHALASTVTLSATGPQTDGGLRSSAPAWFA